jgi:tetrahydromethanopterin S-methyltransferase subunit D
MSPHRGYVLWEGAFMRAAGIGPKTIVLAIGVGIFGLAITAGMILSGILLLFHGRAMGAFLLVPGVTAFGITVKLFIVLVRRGL